MQTLDFFVAPHRTDTDSVTGKPLFIAPRGRSLDDFIRESRAHGWPSFRDEEVLPEFVRVLPDGEAVSVDGTHLGHNLPDKHGNRYCIKLVFMALLCCVPSCMVEIFAL